MNKKLILKRLSALMLALLILCGGALRSDSVFGEENTYYSDWLKPQTEEEPAEEQGLVASGENFRICVTGARDGALPEGAELLAQEINDTEGYVTLAAESVGVGEGDILALRVFDLSLSVDGAEVQPAGPVRVRLEMDVPGDGLAVLHLKNRMPPQAQGPRKASAHSAAANKGFEAEGMDAHRDGGAIEFETDGFSLYAVVGYRLEKTVIASDGVAYRVTVTYGADAGIPEGADLETSEVLESDPAYLEYLRRTAEAMGLEGKDLTHLRLFDIHILSPQGDRVQPLAPVQVTIGYADPVELDEDQMVRVVHLMEDGTEVLVPDVTRTEGGLAGAFSFAAEGFSMYAVVSSGATTNLAGKTFALVNRSSQTAVMDQLNGNYLRAEPVTVSGDNQYLGSQNNDVTLWTFENAGNDQYYIRNQTGDYLHINENSDGVSLSGTPQALTVTAGTGTHSDEIRISRNGNQNRYLYKDTNGFYANNSNTTQNSRYFSLYEVNKLGGPYEGQKISVQDMLDAQNVIIYRSVYNEADDTYEDFVIDGHGNLVRAYDKGDRLTLYSMYSPVWNVTFHRDAVTGELNGYYDFYNPTTGMYLCPRGDGTLVASEQPGVTLNGRRDGEYNSTIESWDTSTWAWYGYKVNDQDGIRLVSGTGNDSEAFSFASLVNSTTNELHPVATVDSQGAGITIRMYDFDSRAQINNVVGGDNYQAGNHYNNSGLASKRLASNGFPTFNNGQHNLSELFNGTYYKGGGNNLFLQSVYNATGYYEYNAFHNYAYYKDGSFTVYQEIGTPSNDNPFYYKRGNFFPYNSLDANRPATNTNLYNGSGQELDYIDPTKAGQLYLVNNPNFYFGMSMEFNFMMPRGGYNNGTPMIYEFNGDDDLWVYIDGVLMLDIGGVHDALPGTINFETGAIHYADSSKNTTIKACFQAAGVFPDGSPWDEARVNEYFSGNTFVDYGSHKFNMFYMEHGDGASNLEMRFNLPVIEKGKVTVEKVLKGTDQQRFSNVSFAYQAFKASGDTRDPDHDEPMIGAVYEGTTTPLTFYNGVTIGGHTYNNVFYLKPGEAAVFPEMVENTKYWVRELGVGSDYYDVIVNDVLIDGEEVTEIDGVYPTTIATVYNRARVTYANKCNEKNHNELLITKRLAEGMEDDGSTFEFRVMLEKSDGTLAPYSTGPYMIRNDAGEYFHYVNGQLTSNGQTPIQASVAGNNGTIAGIPPGYTVVIDGLLVGTDFYVEEIRNPGLWKQESKKVSDCDESTLTGTGFANNPVTADGQIALGKDAQVEITNRKPDPVQTVIRGVKILNGRDMRQGEFTFRMVQINSAGEEIGPAAVTLCQAGGDGEAVPFAFTPGFTFTVQDYLDAEKASDGSAHFYYVVSEVASDTADESGFDAGAQIVYDLNRYLVELVLTYVEDQGILSVEQRITLYDGHGVPPISPDTANA